MQLSNMKGTGSKLCSATMNGFIPLTAMRIDQSVLHLSQIRHIIMIRSMSYRIRQLYNAHPNITMLVMPQ